MLVSYCVAEKRFIEEKEITRNFDALYQQSIVIEEE